MKHRAYSSSTLTRRRALITNGAERLRQTKRWAELRAKNPRCLCRVMR